MGKIGDVVVNCYGIVDFPTQEENGYQDESQWNGSATEIHQRSEQNHHEDNAACPHQSGIPEEGVDRAGRQCGDQDHQQQLFGAIFVFDDRPHQQDQGKIAEQVLPVGMPEDVRENPEIVADAVEVKLAAGCKIVGIEARPNGDTQDVHGEGCQGKSQHDRCIEGDFHRPKIRVFSVQGSMLRFINVWQWLFC